MAAGKFYVVWQGRERGVFDSWEACRELVEGFDGALYKAFPSRELANEAFEKGPGAYLGKKQDRPLWEPGGAFGSPVTEPGVKGLAPGKAIPIENSICVDAACSGNPGKMEYRGVYTGNGQQLFKAGPFEGGTNNIGEFLAIVHALAWCKKKRIDLPVYTDSNTALAWVRKKKANTKLIPAGKNRELFDLIDRAEIWLNENTWPNRLLKWDTAAWGEIPADFGRK